MEKIRQAATARGCFYLSRLFARLYKHSKKVLIEDLFGAYTLNEEYEREIKSLKKELEKYRSY